MVKQDILDEIFVSVLQLENIEHVLENSEHYLGARVPDDLALSLENHLIKIVSRSVPLKSLISLLQRANKRTSIARLREILQGALVQSKELSECFISDYQRSFLFEPADPSSFELEAHRFCILNIVDNLEDVRKDLSTARRIIT